MFFFFFSWVCFGLFFLGEVVFEGFFVFFVFFLG